MSCTPGLADDLEANASSTPPGSPSVYTVSSEFVKEPSGSKMGLDFQPTTSNASASSAVRSETNAMSDTSAATLIQTKIGEASAMNAEQPRQTGAGNSGT